MKAGHELPLFRFREALSTQLKQSRDVTRALEQAKDEGRRADLDLKLRSTRARLDEKAAFAARVICQSFSISVAAVAGKN